MFNRVMQFCLGGGAESKKLTGEMAQWVKLVPLKGKDPEFGSLPPMYMLVQWPTWNPSMGR